MVIPSSDSLKYLGVVISSVKKWRSDVWSDDLEVAVRIREIYKRLFMLKGQTKNLNVLVKRLIFQTYFSQVYGLALWNVSREIWKGFTFALDDAMRALFGVSRYVHISPFYAALDLRHLDVLRRYCIHSSIFLLSTCPNADAKSIYSLSSFCFQFGIH